MQPAYTILTLTLKDTFKQVHILVKSAGRVLDAQTMEQRPARGAATLIGFVVLQHEPTPLVTTARTPSSSAPRGPIVALTKVCVRPSVAKFSHG